MELLERKFGEKKNQNFCKLLKNEIWALKKNLKDENVESKQDFLKTNFLKASIEMDEKKRHVNFMSGPPSICYHQHKPTATSDLSSIIQFQNHGHLMVCLLPIHSSSCQIANQILQITFWCPPSCVRLEKQSPTFQKCKHLHLCT